MGDLYASKIRRRASYRRFSELYEFLKNGPDPEQVL
jgi:hypothetical protein